MSYFENNPILQACGVSIAFHSDKSPVFLVGSEEGIIYKCSTAYSSQYLGRWKAHSMAVSSIKWNPFHKDIFLSSSDDWLIKVWSQNSQTALFSFDLQSPVGDISWSIFSSTAFGAVTSDGKCFIYDLNINKYQVKLYLLFKIFNKFIASLRASCRPKKENKDHEARVQP